MMETDQKDPDLLLTLARALRILSIFNEEKSEYTLHEISNALNIPKSMAFRTLYTLEAMGYLNKNHQTKTYTLGFEILRLGKVMRQNSSLSKLAMPVLQELNDLTKEAVCLVIPDQKMMRGVQVLSMDAKHPIKHDSDMVTVGYLHCGAARKTLLAYMEDEFVDQVIEEAGLPAITENTITDPEILKLELRRIREQGYATSKAEATPDLFSIAAPVFSYEGDITGSIAINLPMYRLNDNEEKLAEWTKAYSAKISGKLSNI